MTRMVSILPVVWLVLLGRHDRQPVAEMLASDQVGIVPSRGDVEHQLQCEPRHGADLVPLAILLDLHVTPCQVSAALGRLGRLDPDSRIGLALALIDGERNQKCRSVFNQPFCEVGGLPASTSVMFLR